MRIEAAALAGHPWQGTEDAEPPDLGPLKNGSEDLDAGGLWPFLAGDDFELDLGTLL